MVKKKGIKSMNKTELIAEVVMLEDRLKDLKTDEKATSNAYEVEFLETKEELTEYKSNYDKLKIKHDYNLSELRILRREYNKLNDKYKILIEDHNKSEGYKDMTILQFVYRKILEMFA